MIISRMEITRWKLELNKHILRTILQDSVFHHVKVKDLLFNGYASGAMSYLIDMYEEIDDLIPFSLPALPDMMQAGVFGLWYGKNDTMEQQYYTINTGDTDMGRYQ